MLDAYLWLKWAHVVSVISWMAGLLYLPRLFVYHSECGPESPQAETFKVMERRLYGVIMTPAMVSSWIFGIGLLLMPGTGFGTGLWIWAKLILVVCLSGFHGYLGWLVKGFEQDRISRGARFFRLINEVPTVIMLAVVFLVVFRPF